MQTIWVRRNASKERSWYESQCSGQGSQRALPKSRSWSTESPQIHRSLFFLARTRATQLGCLLATLNAHSTPLLGGLGEK